MFLDEVNYDDRLLPDKESMNEISFFDSDEDDLMVQCSKGHIESLMDY